jgi:hypothetical protein
MAANNKRNEKFKQGCRFNNLWVIEGETDSGGDLFSCDWEVFVIKRDEKTGKLVGRLACCEIARV